MDAVSGIASVASVATLAAQLSKTLFEICHTVKDAEREVQDVANNISLLALVLEELDEVFRNDTGRIRLELRQAAVKITDRSQLMFEDIERHAGIKRGQVPQLRLVSKMAWYFRNDRVKALQLSLESLKSTLQVLLNLVVLARMMSESHRNNDERYSNPSPALQQGFLADTHESNIAGEPLAEATRKRRVLIALVIDNELSVENLERLERETQESCGPLPPNFLNNFVNSAKVSGMNHDRSDEDYDANTMVLARSADQGIHPPDDSPPPAGPSSDREVHFENANLHGDEDADSVSGVDGSTAGNIREILLYDPPTSEILLDAVPHRKSEEYREEGPNGESPLGRAEGTVNLMLDQYTNPVYQESSPKADDKRLSVRGRLGSFERARPAPAMAPGSWPTTQTYHPGPQLNQDRMKDSKGFHPARFSGNQAERFSRNPREFMAPPPAKDDIYEVRQRPSVSEREPVFVYDGFSTDYSRSNSPSSSDDDSLVYRKPRFRSNGKGPKSHSRHKSVRTRTEDVLMDEIISRATQPHVQLARLEDKHRALEQEVKMERAIARAKQEARDSINDANKRDTESFAKLQQNKPVVLKDCLGRSFSLPIESCRSWEVRLTFFLF